MRNRSQYIIIGAGPAGICEISNMIKKGVSCDDIIWIDPKFNVGDFGTTLSKGSSVPGNTMVKDYQKVNKEIYQAVPICKPEKNQQFALDRLPPNYVCSLKIAAEPLQHITNKLRHLVPSIEGHVIDIVTMPNEFMLKVNLTNGEFITLFSEHVTLAIGATPRNLTLPDTFKDKIMMIDPNTVFIETELKEFLNQHPHTKTIAVVGSSHSAALATMHLLKAGISVKQFMDKEYKYATPAVTGEGKPYTIFDNTGLKGEVALFTKKLLENKKLNQGEYRGKLIQYIGKNRQEVDVLLTQELVGCDYVVACIGYEPAMTLKINGRMLSTFFHNKETLQFEGMEKLRGIGIAYPKRVKAPSGEVELAVGIGKFWSTSNGFQPSFFLENSSTFFSTKKSFAHKDEVNSKLELRAKL